MTIKNQVAIINKIFFVKTALNENPKAFIVYIIFLSINFKITIYLAQKAQIMLFVAKKVAISAKYLDNTKVFFKKFVAKLPKHFDIKKYLINLELNKQPIYVPIYSPKPVKLKILKTYIKTKFINSFIGLSKSPAEAFILFIQKPKKEFLFIC